MNNRDYTQNEKALTFAVGWGCLKLQADQITQMPFFGPKEEEELGEAIQRVPERMLPQGKASPS